MRDIPRESWRDELDSVSRQREEWVVSLRATTPGGEVNASVPIGGAA